MPPAYSLSIAMSDLFVKVTDSEDITTNSLRI
jgi:hypothetical protein